MYTEFSLSYINIKTNSYTGCDCRFMKTYVCHNYTIYITKNWYNTCHDIKDLHSKLQWKYIFIDHKTCTLIYFMVEIRYTDFDPKIICFWYSSWRFQRAHLMYSIIYWISLVFHHKRWNIAVQVALDIYYCTI